LERDRPVRAAPDRPVSAKLSVVILVAIPSCSERGAGSHGTLYVGDRYTVVKDLKKELGPGLLSDVYKQLGIRKEDL